MAYAAVASLSQTIHLLLNYHQHSVSPQFNHQILSLQKHAIFFQSFLEDASERANNWEETIREVADRAEDIIELLLSDSLLESTVGSSKPKLGKGKHEIQYGFDEVERVTEEMESIADRVKGRRRTEATGGSDDELWKIINRLRGRSSERETIAIVGMEGIGKTTLARKAFNHPSIVDHFDIRAWSTVTSDYVRQRMMGDLVHSMKAKSLSNSEADLIESLGSNIGLLRYLIVLDDVCSLESLVWLKAMLPDFGNGSRIIITTRSLELATTAGHIHEMGLLDEDKTWNLLRANIFEGDPCPSQLESVGKMISRSCRGHPLSIEVVSGILAADQTEAAWEDVSEDIIIASHDVGRELTEILSLSYIYLPHHLRPCFLYLGIFRKDEDIHVSKLIKLWVAEGFLLQSEFKSLEETGEEHVEDLVRRSLVSVSKRKSNGRTKSIKIHDLMLDVCLRQAHHTDEFILNLSRFDQALAVKLELCRRVSIFTYGDYIRHVIRHIIHGSTIRRTIMSYLDDSQLSVKWPIGNVRLLRILDLSNTYKYALAEEVFELFLLRFLAFHSRVRIPEAISNLENLQTLIICPSEDDSTFANLPEGIWRMPQLRHLLMFSFKLPGQKEATSPLENMQTLSRVINFICSIENLKKIPNLKKLSLFYTLRGVVENYELHNLMYLQKLEILKIEIDWSLREQPKTSCAFPPTLKKLSLSGVRFAWEDMKIVGLLPSLQVLKLRIHACTGDTWKTSEGGFSQLTYLKIELADLVSWITESSHFPRLKSLLLYRCWCLLEVPSDIGIIPTLQLIEFDRHSKNLLLSTKRIQEDRQSLGCDPLHINAV